MNYVTDTIGYLRVQLSLLGKEHDRTRKTAGNRVYEGDFNPINVDLLIEKFEVSPSNAWYNNPDQTQVGRIQKSVMTRARRLTVPSPEEYVDHQEVIRNHLTFSAFKRLELS